MRKNKKKLYFHDSLEKLLTVGVGVLSMEQEKNSIELSFSGNIQMCPRKKMSPEIRLRDRELQWQS